MTKKELISKEQSNFKNQMDPECEEQRNVEKNTIVQWCMKTKVNLLDPTYFDDETEYTLDEFNKKIPREIQIPLVNDLSGQTALEDFAKGILPEGFVKDYKKMVKLQTELKEAEEQIKNKLITMFESIPDLEKNYVLVDGLRFSYVKSSVRKTVDSKKLQEEYPNIYKKMLKESKVKSSIRTKVEY